MTFIVFNFQCPKHDRRPVTVRRKLVSKRETAHEKFFRAARAQAAVKTAKRESIRR